MANNGNEEISLSVEESNALRIKLGLKPLRIHAEGTNDSDLPILEPIVNAADERDALEKREVKRLADSLSSGGGVLDIFGDSCSTEDWLSQQKKKFRAEPEPEDSESSSSSDGESSLDSGSNSD